MPHVPDHQPAPSPPGRTPTLPWLGLLASSGTLICCALPILLVSLGLGATVAALTSSFPLLISLVEYKAWLFACSAALLTAAAYSSLRPARLCPADPVLATACRRARRLSIRLLWLSLGIWITEFGMAYLALPLRIWLGA
ncbi:hypothetical protein ACSX1C_09220 [Pseudomonas sp. MBLB4123]|uniref:hypothetical protein n=1 Tax=Pseudomonas sp. MBLB4123 TaxID=3451557 RepID=UPI003F74BD84